MPDVTGDAVRELARGRDQATKAASLLLRLKRAARDSGDYDRFERYSTAYTAALEAEDKATKRLIAGLANPDEAKVRQLSTAIDELKARLTRLKRSEAALNDVASGITILTHAILLFGML
jgi:hypothetical protein